MPTPRSLPLFSTDWKRYFASRQGRKKMTDFMFYAGIGSLIATAAVGIWQVLHFNVD